MNKYNIISFFGFLALVVVFPIYAWYEPVLRDVAQNDLQNQYVIDASIIYVENCAVCHGIEGEGSDLGLPLNTADIQSREADELIRIISEGVSGTAMVPWHNVFSPAEIEAIVGFLQHWDEIEAEGVVLTPPEPVWVDVEDPEAMLALGERIYSTTCVACHGEDGSGGTGPVLNSQQVLTANTDEQLRNTIINGGWRPNSTMPSFGDRLTSVEINAIVSYLRAWEPTAPFVENPRGTQQGGGPPWLRTDDGTTAITPGGGGQGQGNQGGGGPPWRNAGSSTNPVNP